MRESEWTDKLDRTFSWMDNVPVALTLSDANTLEVLKCNHLFADFFHLTPSTISAGLSDMDTADGAKSVITLKIGGHTVCLYTGVKRLNLDGVPIILAAHEELTRLLPSDEAADLRAALEKTTPGITPRFIVLEREAALVANGIYDRQGGLAALKKQMERAAADEQDAQSQTMEAAPLTLVYFRLAIFSEGPYNEAAAFDHALTIIKGGTRQTDILANMDKRDYILIFPHCAYEVAESIMGTIEKKIEVFNSAADAPHDICIKYTIAEYNPNKKQTPEALVDELKKDII